MPPMSLPALSGPVVHQASALAVLIPQEEVSGGTLLVRPLSLDSLSEVSELLTEVPCRPSSHQSTPGPVAHHSVPCSPSCDHLP